MACRAGDTLVVISLDRLARSVSDARDLVADLAKRGVILHLGGSVHDPSDPLGPVLEMVADFQTALVRGRTAEGMRLARTRGRLKGRPPKVGRMAEARTWSSWSRQASTAAQRSPTCSR